MAQKEYLKMADVFNGEIDQDDIVILDCGFDTLNKAPEDYAAHAINSHDELVAEVERLRNVVLECASALYIADKFCGSHTSDDCDDSIAIPISDALKKASKEIT